MLEINVRKSFHQKDNEAPQIEESFDVSWDSYDDYEYYTLEIVNVGTQERHLHRMNIPASGSQEGEDLVPENNHYNGGVYKVSLYGQDEYLERMNSRRLHLLEEAEIHLRSIPSLAYDLMSNSIKPHVKAVKRLDEKIFSPRSAASDISWGGDSRSYGQGVQDRTPSLRLSPLRSEATSRRRESPPSRSASPLRGQSQRSPSPSRRSPVSGQGLREQSQRSPSPSRRSPGARRSPMLSQSPGRSKDIVSGLGEGEAKYCSCVLKVAGKQSQECLSSKRWGEVIDGKRCYNPNAVCGRLPRPANGQCAPNYNFDEMTDDELVAYANLHNKRTPKLNRNGKLTKRAREELLATVRI